MITNKAKINQVDEKYENFQLRQNNLEGGITELQGNYDNVITTLDNYRHFLSQGSNPPANGQQGQIIFWTKD